MTKTVEMINNNAFTSDNLPEFTVDSHATHNLADFVVTSLADVTDQEITIRPRERGEIFTTTEDELTLSCLIERTQDSSGNFLNEVFYPVKQDLIPELSSQIRIVTFHGCHSLENGYFIYPRKNNSGAFKNSWNSSLEQALRTPVGTYFSLSVNAQLQTYEVEFFEGRTLEQPSSFPDFQPTLSEILSKNIVTSANHQMVQALLNK